jgi:IS30 family transposase
MYATAAWRKGSASCGKDIIYITRVLPKGSSFDALAQPDIDLMLSHINSYSREKLNDKSPLDMFNYMYGDAVLEKLKVNKICHSKILLTPSLLKK